MYSLYLVVTVSIFYPDFSSVISGTMQNKITINLCFKKQENTRNLLVSCIFDSSVTFLAEFSLPFLENWAGVWLLSFLIEDRCLACVNIPLYSVLPSPLLELHGQLWFHQVRALLTGEWLELWGCLKPQQRKHLREWKIIRLW